jgi:hypothetical protein
VCENVYQAGVSTAGHPLKRGAGTDEQRQDFAVTDRAYKANKTIKSLIAFLGTTALMQQHDVYQ